MMYKTIKTWALRDPELEDAQWLQSMHLGFRFREPDLITIQGYNYSVQVPGRRGAMTIITTKPEEETIVILKYADRLVLENAVQLATATIPY
jgi:hypothetical protein